MVANSASGPSLPASRVGPIITGNPVFGSTTDNRFFGPKNLATFCNAGPANRPIFAMLPNIILQAVILLPFYLD